jgi:hypothetical protein
VFSSEPDRVTDLEVECPIANSDHNVIIWRVSGVWDSVVVEKRFYKYHKGKYEKINEELLKIDWDKVWEGATVKRMWSSFLTRVLEIRDKFVPTGNCKGKEGKRPGWLNKRIINDIKKRGMKWKKWQDRMTYENEKDYKRLRNKITSDIRKAKSGFEEKIANNIKMDNKTFYAYVRGRSRVKVKVGPLKREDGVVVSDDRGMAELLSDYFAQVFTKEDTSNIPVACFDRVVQLGVRVEQVVIREEMVEEVIRKLKDNKAAGVDELNSTFLKGSVKGLAKPLANIFRESLRSGKVPDDWKVANVAAIFKKGVRWDPGNYRPVSLTSQVGKVLEKLIKEVVVDYLEKYELIGRSQHGFRKNKSCLTNLLEFFELISNRLDNREWVDVLYLDFRKAFDTVPHVRLIAKLEAIGIRGQVLKWIKDWLAERKQRVILAGEVSRWEKVVSGVPQGSVLGPVLFLVYIEDIDNGMLNRILKFADDTKVIGRVVNDEDIMAMKEDLKKLYEWSVRWQMGFNADKCKVMHFGIGNKKSVYELGGKVIKECVEEKDLGVLVSRDGKVDKQCAEAAKKGFQMLGMISRTFSSRKKVVLGKLYKSMVRPALEYCIQAWRPSLKKDIEVLERVQRRATRMVDECRGLDYGGRLKRMNLTTLETRRLRADLIEVYRIMHGLEGLNEEDFFIRTKTGAGLGGGTKMNLRGNSWKVYKKRFSSNYGRNSFGNRVVSWWNKIPDSVIEGEGGLNAFKGRLDKLMAQVWGLT